MELIILAYHVYAFNHFSEINFTYYASEIIKCIWENPYLKKSLIVCIKDNINGWIDN